MPIIERRILYYNTGQKGIGSHSMLDQTVAPDSIGMQCAMTRVRYMSTTRNQISIWTLDKYVITVFSVEDRGYIRSSAVVKCVP